MEGSIHPFTAHSVCCWWRLDPGAQSTVSKQCGSHPHSSTDCPDRYRLVPTFGRDTIRRFTRNTSGLKKLAARDWEDMLQVCLPILEGLLPRPCDVIVQDLIFTLCTWHAYAKLRLHTTATIQSLSTTTTNLGTHLRRFKTQVCTLFYTRELPREEAARGRRKAALAAQRGKGPTATATPAASSTTSCPKLFNMSTYKLHALGDYVASIIAFGPTDNYSTQIVRSRQLCSHGSLVLTSCLTGRVGAPSREALLRSH